MTLDEAVNRAAISLAISSVTPANTTHEATNLAIEEPTEKTVKIEIFQGTFMAIHAAMHVVIDKDIRLRVRRL